MRGYVVPREKPERCARCHYVDEETLDCTLMEDASDYTLVTAQHANCPLIPVEIVDVKEVIMPIGLIGGYLRRATE